MDRGGRQEFEDCPVDTMLKEMLVDCHTHGDLFDEGGKTSLFEECLEKVLPICNGEAQTEHEKTEAKPSKIREKLEEYSKLHSAPKKDWYPPFVDAANVALQFLQEVEVGGLQRNDDLIRFQVFDPSVSKQKHKGGPISESKPDVIVISEELDRSNDPSTTSNVSAPKANAKSPNTRSQWRDVRTFVEFQRKSTKSGMELPPKSYTSQPYTGNSATEYLALDSARTSPITTTSTSLSMARLPVIQQSSHQGEKSIATNSSDRQRTATEELSSSTLEYQSSGEQMICDPIAQAADYAAAMFTAHAGRLHVFGFIVVGDILYLWRYDREGAIQSSGLNFIQDLPRFLLLLLALQRFNNKNWGLNPCIDPDFGQLPEQSREFTLTGAEGKQVTLTPILSDDWTPRFGLTGRSTYVFPIKCSSLSGHGDLVAKVSWPQAERTSEPDILKQANKFGEKHVDIKGHIPQVLWYKKFEDVSTAKIRKRLGLSATLQSSRVLYMIVFQKLKPITELTGKDFLDAWWATVRCHRALWKNGIYHCDISTSNLMYREDKKGIVGVLNDFDLASIKNVRNLTGTQGTGTVPFMALALLEYEALRGETKHLYQHDAESFVWVLIWITLRFSNGKPRELGDTVPQLILSLNRWLGVDATSCRETKLGFLLNTKLFTLRAGQGHEENWEVAKRCIGAMRKELVRNISGQPLSVDKAFKSLLKEPSGLL